MSAFLNTRTILAGTATAIFVAMAMSGSANASASSKLAQCKTNSRGAAVSCCHDVVRKYGVPQWMGTSDNCNKVVSCGKYSNNYNCYVTWENVKVKLDDNNDNPGGKNYNTKP
jgi:hypothetical protein